MNQRLHSNRGYLHLILFIALITTLHLLSHFASQQTPQIVKYLIDPSDNPPLDEMYNGGWSISYLFRNLTLVYSIYPAVLFTFLIDHYKKEHWLKWLNWKIILFFLVSIGIVATLLSGPQLYVPRGMVYYAKIVFESGGRGGFFIFAVITWISLVVLSFKILKNKIPNHHALWLTLLIFLSCQEVWEYAPYIWAHQPITLPLNLLISSYTWRAMPSMLLVYYVWKYRFSSWKNTFFLSFFISVAISLSFIFMTERYKMGAFLRVTWATTYLLYASSLNCASSSQTRGHSFELKGNENIMNKPACYHPHPKTIYSSANHTYRGSLIRHIAVEKAFSYASRPISIMSRITHNHRLYRLLKSPFELVFGLNMNLPIKDVLNWSLIHYVKDESWNYLKEISKNEKTKRC